MKKRCILILLLLSISLINFASAMSYQVVDWRTMKTGDTWSNIPGGGNITLNSLVDSNHVITTIAKYGHSQLNLTKGVIFQYNVNGYVFNITSISISSGHNGVATLFILKKICTPNWQCEPWGKCTDGVQWRTCKDINECGVATNYPTENQLCCTPSWTCSVWSNCTNNQQTRTCKDYNKCGILVGEPSTTQACQPSNLPDANNPNPTPEECTEDWQCFQWSQCINNLFTRTCTDMNDCGTEDNKPQTSITCTNECLESWRCSSWSTCVNNQQIRTCSDLNDCNTFDEMPSLMHSCGTNNNPPIPDLNYPSSHSGWSYGPINFTWNYSLPNPININISSIPLFNPDFFIWWILLLLLYIYISLTYTLIGRRAKAYHYGIAWVPIFGPLLVASRTAQMGSWPMWLLFALVLSGIAETVLMFTPLALFSFTLIYLNYILTTIFLIYSFIWTWKMFNAVKRPGWWSLVNIVPILGWIAFLTFLGIAAWGKFDDGNISKTPTTESKKIKKDKKDQKEEKKNN